MLKQASHKQLSNQKSRKSAHRVVLDTNVLISALGWDGVERQITLSILKARCLYTSPKLLSELARVLIREKFSFIKKEQKHAIINILEQLAHIVCPTTSVHVSRDEKYNLVLECALAAKATHIITGDKDPLELEEFRGTSILSARAYAPKD